MSAPPSTSQALCQLLLLLSRGASHDGVLRCHANAGPHALGPRELFLHVGDISGSWIPPALLPRLECDAAPWAVSFGVRGPSGGLMIAAVAAWWNFDRIYENPTHPERKTGRRWSWPEREIAAAITRAEGFLPPTMIVDARAFVLGLWSLSCPLRGRADDSAIKHLFMRVAERVGADVVPANVRLDDLQVPIPGFPVANATADADVVRCPELHPERLYTLHDVEAALMAPQPDKHITPAVPSARRRKEKTDGVH